jgi:hypothetical protein
MPNARRQWSLPARRVFEAVVNRAITQDDAGECLLPQTMDGFASDILLARREGAA